MFRTLIQDMQATTFIELGSKSEKVLNGDRRKRHAIPRRWNVFELALRPARLGLWAEGPWNHSGTGHVISTSLGKWPWANMRQSSGVKGLRGISMWLN